MNKFVKYNFFKNTKYALEGIKELILNETSFKIELFIIAILWVSLYFIDISFIYKMILAISLFLPLLAEGINSAIEHTVDLITKDFHPIAKKAKDVASGVVFMSLIITTCIWVSVIYLIISKAS
jgi:diacylglycerol kinase (ATP)